MWSSLGNGIQLLLIFYIGWVLVKIRQWKAIWQTIVVLWLIPVPTLLMNYILLKLTAGQGVDYSNGVLLYLVNAILWTAYFLRSARIKATYNKPGFDSEIVSSPQPV